MDQDVTKKLKGLDGNAVPVSSGQLAIDASDSLEENGDGMTGGEADQHTQEDKGSEKMQSAGNPDTDVEVHPDYQGDINRNFTGSSDVVQASMGSSCDDMGTGSSFFNPSAGERLPFDAMALDERQLKREKRKQANRESARRSRMRKQAEYEELVKSCDSLTTEQIDLKSELDQLKVAAEKLRLENAALKEQLKIAHIQQEGDASPKTEGKATLPNDAKDILNNLGDMSSNSMQTHETSISETITQLHQLMESTSRTDAVAAR